MAQQLKVTNIQRGCVNDGPGVRTVIFLRGCPFSCPWCCNPETLNCSPEYFTDDEKCLLLNGTESRLCSGCERKGGTNSILSCPFSVAVHVFKSYGLESLFKEINRDRSLFVASGGGVTFSGGDPIIHLDALIPLLSELNASGIDVCFETTLFYKNQELLSASMPFIDRFIVDLKLQGVNYKPDYIGLLKDNLGLLRKNNKEIIFRLVHVKGMTVTENIIEVLKILKVDELELLKCHALSESKYRKLGLQFMDLTPEDFEFIQFNNTLNKYGIRTKSLKI